MGFTLGTQASRAGYRLAAFDTIGSTSAEALERAKAGDPGRLWVVAEAQTAGRGRRGRAWQTPAGNLAASLLVGGELAAPDAARLGFVAGLALESAIRASAAASSPLWGEGRGRRPCLALKWPNDLLLDGAKVAGILLEAVSVPRGRASVVVGIGVNIQHAPKDVPYPATSLAACGIEVDAEELFVALSDAWVEQHALWDEGRGFADVRRRWLQRAAGVGGPIAVNVGKRIIRGNFQSIDEEGRLVVREANGSAQAVTAGEVHFGAAATAVA